MTLQIPSTASCAPREHGEFSGHHAPFANLLSGEFCNYNVYAAKAGGRLD